MMSAIVHRSRWRFYFPFSRRVTIRCATRFVASLSPLQPQRIRPHVLEFTKNRGSVSAEAAATILRSAKQRREPLIFLVEVAASEPVRLQSGSSREGSKHFYVTFLPSSCELTPSFCCYHFRLFPLSLQVHTVR